MRSSALEWAAWTTCLPRSVAHVPAAVSTGLCLLRCQGPMKQLPFRLVRLPPVATAEALARQLCERRSKHVVTRASCLSETT